ncbi:glycosyltransferase family 4 protein [beta proteobacterium MWH-UniP1]
MTRRIDVRILTPFGASSGMGNWRTASRYAQMLRASGLNASIYDSTKIEDACAESGQRTVAIVLNAARCAEHVHTFVAAGIPVMIVMTGTDLYGALRPDAAGQSAYVAAENAMHAASMLLTLQEEAQKEIQQRWPDLADRVFVLTQTSPPRKPYAPPVTPQSKTVRFMIAGHIREEKDPRTAFRAFHLAFPQGWATRADGGRVPVRLIHVGSYQDKNLAHELMLLAGQYPGVLLEGSLTHAATMRQMTHVHCLIQPSLSEGGALVIAEAVACRLPVIASNIPAHRAQLGADYPGLFRVGDAQDLARQLQRFVADADFLEQLRRRQGALTAKLASPAQERDELVRLVRQLVEFLPEEQV